MFFRCLILLSLGMVTLTEISIANGVCHERIGECNTSVIASQLQRWAEEGASPAKITWEDEDALEEMTSEASALEEMTPHLERLTLDMPTPEIIAHQGYPVETHTAETEDGYILTMHR